MSPRYNLSTICCTNFLLYLGGSIIIIYRDALDRTDFEETHYFSDHQATLLIHVFSLYHRDETDESRLAVEIMAYIMNSGIRVIDIFDRDPSAVLDLIRIAQLFPYDIGIPLLPMLIDLINKRAE